MDVFAKIKAFRQDVYNNLCRAQDATFELMDAVMLTCKAYSLADLSQSFVFRRKWPSIYEALQDTRPQRQKLMKLYIKQMPTSGRIVLAGDHTAWSRPNAVTLKNRTMEHHAHWWNTSKQTNHLESRLQSLLSSTIFVILDSNFLNPA